MHSRILEASTIIDFTGVGHDSKEVQSIKLETDKLLGSIQNEKCKDWEVQFVFNYTNVKQVLVSKGLSYPNEKQKEITIHIPIPTLDTVKWGVALEQHVYKDNSYLDHIMKNFTPLDVNFSDYNTRDSYILDCMRRGIKLSLEKGFTVNGVKVKID